MPILRRKSRGQRFIIPVAILLLAGCASPWEKFYQPHRRAEPVSAARVQHLSLARYQSFSGTLENLDANSDVAAADLPQEDRRQRKLMALQMMQIPPDYDALLLGSSSLWSVQPLDPDDGQLSAFARRIGANYAVVVTADGGLGQRIVSAPSYSSGIVSNGYSTANYSGWSSTPVVVTERRINYLVFFVRSHAH